jgi:hypothetical protein
MRTLLAACVLVAACVSATARGAEPGTLPAAQELEGMYAAGKYQELLKHLGKALALKGEAARPYKRFDMLMLKGDAHLMLKQTSWGLESYAAAAKEPGDAKVTAVARATEVLLRRSNVNGYVPKTVPVERGKRPEPIAVAERESRKKAMAALLVDEMAVFRPKLKRALAAPVLGETVELAGGIADLGAVEIAATGDDAEVRKAAAALSDHATAVMSEAIRSMDKRVDEIFREANEKQEEGVSRRTGLIVYSRAGLSGKMMTDLKGTVKAANEISVMAQRLAVQFKGDHTTYDAIVAHAALLSRHASDVLNRDYTGLHTE